jgi:hypothetical protein
MNLGRAFRFAARDPAWLSKFGVGAVISIVPILSFAGVGYGAEVARRVAAGQDGELPSWDNLGDLFLTGARLGLAQGLLALPAAVFLCLPLFSAWLLLITSDPTHSLDDRMPAVLLICGAGLTLWLAAWLLLSFVSPAMLANFVRRGTFAACFDVRAFARLIASDPKGYMTVVATLIALGIGAAVILTPLTTMFSLIPCLGFFAYVLLYGGFYFYALLVQGHLVGQLLQATAAAAPDASAD